MIQAQSPCPCGNSQTYAQCCGSYHDGARPETAEKLMRSRYSAYVVGKIPYIAETNDPQTGGDFDAEAAETWSRQSEWKGLEIVATREGQKGDATGEVEFIARYSAEGESHEHHEVSLFRFDEGQKRWFYRDGKTVRQPERRTEPKLGRNDPCHCGSGKKFKKCCG
jgi:SEC-C motif-containing protein